MSKNKWLDLIDRLVYWLQNHETAAFFLFIGLVVAVYGAVKLRPLISVTGVGIAFYGLYEERYGPDFEDAGRYEDKEDDAE